MGEAIDFAIITVVELERLAVCEALQLTKDDRVSKESRIYWRKSLNLGNGEFYDIVVAQSPDMAGVDAALLVADVIHHWHPAAILLVGIAAGVNRETQQLGDLVIGSDVYYCDRGKLTPTGKRPEPIMYRADATLWNHIRAIPEWASPHTLVRPDGTQTPPKIHYGVIASGEKVIADAIVRDEITAGHRKIVAIEMEGYGFSAGAWQSFEQIRHLVIKSICDFADATKGDNWQPYAAGVAAEFTKYFLLDKPLPPRNPPLIPASPVDARYRLIIDSLKSGSLVPFLGPGINARFYIALASQFAEFVEQELLNENGGMTPTREKLIKKLIGIPCSVCHYWPKDRPEGCPMLKDIAKGEGCPLYMEQELAVSKINLRYLSEYYVLKNSLDTLYTNLYEILERIEQQYQPNALHHFLAELPRLMFSKNYPRRSPGLPYQLIVTTNYDDMLEQAFLAAKQPFDLVFYVADGDERGKFKHQPYEGAAQTIETRDYDGLPLRSPWGRSNQPRPVILKLFGNWETPWENNFVATEQQFTFLIDTLTQKNLPTSLMGILRQKSNILFMGYSPTDTDLDRIMHCFWPEKRIPNQSWLLHQAQPGYLEQEIWETRNVDLLKMPFPLDEFVAQLKGGIEAQLPT